MKSQIFITYLLVLLYVVKIESFRLENCGTKDAIFQDVSLSVSPDPIKLKEKVSVSLHANLVKDVPENAIVEMKMFRKIKWNVRLPCLDGSVKPLDYCKMEFCDFLGLFQNQIKDFFPPGRSTQCPIRKGIYQGQNVKMNLPVLGKFLSIIEKMGGLKGEYSAKIKVFEKDGGQQLACWKLYAELG